jgi:hypothetical protein
MQGGADLTCSFAAEADFQNDHPTLNLFRFQIIRV